MIAVSQIKSPITLEEFLKLPETKPYSEYINGKIEQKPMPQGKHSIIQTSLSIAINQVARSQKIGLALTELRCTFGGRSIVPDISVFTLDRIPKDEKGEIANRFTVHPDWVIEILSPEQSANKVIEKIVFCINQGTEIGWLIAPEDESVIIFKQDELPSIKSEQEILPVLESCQDLQLSSTEIFSWLSFD